VDHAKAFVDAVKEYGAVSRQLLAIVSMKNILRKGR
jgi:hypothetical protein